MSPFRRAVQCLRPAPGAYVDGRWVAGDATPFAIQASVQPATGNDLKSLSENRRSGSIYALYTDSAMQTLDEDLKLQPDVVTLHDGDYEVVHAERWQNNIINHWKVLVRRGLPGVPL